MSIEAIRCPGCKNLVNVAELEKHYGTNHHDGIVQGATTITTANPNQPMTQAEKGLFQWATGYPPPRQRVHAFDSPIWGPLLRRFFPHIIFGAFALGIIIGILAW